MTNSTADWLTNQQHATPGDWWAKQTNQTINQPLPDKLPSQSTTRWSRQCASVQRTDRGGSHVLATGSSQTSWFHRDVSRDVMFAAEHVSALRSGEISSTWGTSAASSRFPALCFSSEQLWTLSALLSFNKFILSVTAGFIFNPTSE